VSKYSIILHHFKHRFNHKEHGGFLLPQEEGHLLVDGKRHCISWSMVSIYPVTTKIQASFLTQLLEKKETAQGFYHEVNGDFKTVTEFNGC
jgi:hypothetical protein